MMNKPKFYYKGKRVSKGEYFIAIWLESHNVRFIKEQQLSNCLSKNGRPLRVDFFLPDLNIVIEMQGEHHYKPVNKYRKALITHEITKERDIIKKDYLLSKGISLLTIPYWEKEIIPQILEQHIQPLKIVIENINV